MMPHHFATKTCVWHIVCIKNRKAAGHAECEVLLHCTWSTIRLCHHQCCSIFYAFGNQATARMTMNKQASSLNGGLNYPRNKNSADRKCSYRVWLSISAGHVLIMLVASWNFEMWAQSVAHWGSRMQSVWPGLRQSNRVRVEVEVEVEGEGEGGCAGAGGRAGGGGKERNWRICLLPTGRERERNWNWTQKAFGFIPIRNEVLQPTSCGSCSWLWTICIDPWEVGIKIAERGFDPRTFGLWAQHASHCATPLVIMYDLTIDKSFSTSRPWIGQKPTAPHRIVTVVWDHTYMNLLKPFKLIRTWQWSEGSWCSGITSASHAEGPGFNPQWVHFF